ncbi:MAG: alanine racemase [Lachnospiraceae bacterium]|nr:alanine racemase [Lachnospiraceae bacterium]
MNHYERVCASVSLDAIINNVEQIHSKQGDAVQIMAVVKSDGYGHGALPIARCLEAKDYIYGFATATAEEALILRRCGIVKPIMILGYTFPYAYEDLINENITFTVFRKDMAEEISALAVKLGKIAKVHVKVDTGMHRIGIRPDEEGLSFIKELLALPGIQAEGIFTHLANGDAEDKSDAYSQVELFKTLINSVEEKLGYTFPVRHCFNSAGLMEMKEDAFNVGRVGISMYGVWPSDEMKKDSMTLQPALSLYSKIVYIKTLPAGAKISYGGTFVTTEETRVATVPVGYGDGYPRGLSNCGSVIVAGKRCPILGRVCMDQFMIDVTHLPEIKEGEKVTLIGRDGAEEITVEQLCDVYGGFRYEMICDIGKRVPKEYYLNGDRIYSKDYHNDLA